MDQVIRDQEIRDQEIRNRDVTDAVFLIPDF